MVFKPTHGMRRSSEYFIWCSIIQRCENPKCHAYKNYGGRGIKICADWRADFSKFFADMGRRPSPDYTIDRVDNNGDYEPGNCEWATRLQQGANRRNTVLLTHNGRTASVLQWAFTLGISDTVIRDRLRKDPTDVSAALAPLAMPQRRNRNAGFGEKSTVAHRKSPLPYCSKGKMK